MLISRRAALRALGGLGLAAGLAACASPYADVRLSVATGSRNGVYYTLGEALSTAWRDALGLRTPPVVTSTDGSINNLQLLADRKADVAFNQIDTAADRIARTAPGDPAALRALARIYDDVVHVVVPASLAADLGHPAARRPGGAREPRLRRAVHGAAGARRARHRARTRTSRPATSGSTPPWSRCARAAIDAFFWSGGVPTRGVADLAASEPIRLLTVQDDLTRIHLAYPEYAPGTVPVGTYGLTKAVTTLLLRNVLLVRAEMPDDVAYALVAALFSRQEQIAQSSPNALTIDMRAAIGTQPVPLHPGAENWFRAARNT